MKKTLFLLFVLVTFQLSGQHKPDFRPPMDIPHILSGNFGELRSDHFHSGIDIKTQGVSGQKVYSIEDGYVSRIKIQAGGYGKALYINHPGGYTSVYGHLSDYNKEIGEYIKNIQYRNESHAVDIYLKAGTLPVKKGELVALSGNTGSSSGPHLHFEVRSSAKQHPLNVLLYDFPVMDQISPDIRKLVLYGLDGQDMDKAGNDKVILPVRKKNGIYTLDKKTVRVNGRIGLGIEVFDFLNGASNRCGIYTLKMEMDGKEYFYSEMGEFSFSESRFINAHMDYALKKENSLQVQRLYKLPYNPLSIYKNMVNNGILEIKDTLLHHIRISTEDSYGNLSILEFDLKGTGVTPNDLIKQESGLMTIPFASSSEYSNEELSLKFPAYGFYENIEFIYEKEERNNKLYSSIHKIHKESVPVHRPYELAIKATHLPVALREKGCIVKIDDEDIIYAGGTYSNGYVRSSTRSFGKYAIAVDTISPEIHALNISRGKDMTNVRAIKFNIKDDLSGIESYDGYVDGTWILFEYDPKNDLLSYEFDSKVPISKKNHELEIVLTDAQGNKSVFKTGFYR